MKENILITGASGFISKWFIEALDELNNFNIYLLFNSTNNSTLYSSKVKKFYCDITNKAKIIEIFDNIEIDYIYHFAAKSIIQKSSKNDSNIFDVNIQGTWNLLELAREKLVKGFVMASSMSVYGEKKQMPYVESDSLDGDTGYSLSKICAEEIANFYSKTYQIPTVSLRLGMIFGGGDEKSSRLIPSIIYSLLEKQNIHLRSTANTTIDPLYIKDLVNVLLRLLNYFKTKKIGYEAMNVSSNKAIPISEIVNILVSISNNQKAKVFYGDSSSKKTYMNNNKVTRELNWVKDYSLEHALEETFLYYERQTNE